MLNRVNILIDLVFEITFEKVEKSNKEKQIFKDGAKISPPPASSTVRVKLYVPKESRRKGSRLPFHLSGRVLFQFLEGFRYFMYVHEKSDALK